MKKEKRFEYFHFIIIRILLPLPLGYLETDRVEINVKETKMKGKKICVRAMGLRRLGGSGKGGGAKNEHERKSRKAYSFIFVYLICSYTQNNTRAYCLYIVCMRNDLDTNKIYTGEPHFHFQSINQL